MAKGLVEVADHAIHVDVIGAFEDLVGFLVVVAYLVYLFRRLGRVRRIGRALAARGDEAARRVRPLGPGRAAGSRATPPSRSSRVIGRVAAPIATASTPK